MTTETIILLFAALATSTLSGVMGMGGGILLLTVMAQFFPPATLIPLHGVIQLGSNGMRAALQCRSIDKKIAIQMVLGALVGAGVGSQVVIDVPVKLYSLILAVFIIVFTWMPKLKRAPQIRHKFLILGAMASLGSLFVGAIGPLLAPFFLREGLSKEGIIATKAFIQGIIHALKIFIFMSLGFVFKEYALLLFGMVPMVFLGTWIGKKILYRVSDTHFKLAFKILISCLAIRMLLKWYL